MKNIILIMVMLLNGSSLAMDIKNTKKLARERANTFLLLALEAGDTDKINQALDAGADYTIMDKFIEEQDLEIEKKDRALKLHEEEKNQKKQAALLHKAIAKRNIKALYSLLFKDCVNPNLLDNQANTALYNAIQLYSRSLYKLLLNLSLPEYRIEISTASTKFRKSENSLKQDRHHINDRLDIIKFLLRAKVTISHKELDLVTSYKIKLQEKTKKHKPHYTDYLNLEKNLQRYSTINNLTRISKSNANGLAVIAQSVLPDVVFPQEILNIIASYLNEKFTYSDSLYPA
jgi:hypothetical protein